MADSSVYVKPDSYSDKVYISKRSIRKTIVSKRRYVPAESEVNGDCGRGGFTPRCEEQTLPTADGDSAMAYLNPATPEGSRFCESLTELSYVEMERVFKSEESQKAGSDQDDCVSANHMAGQDPSNSSNHVAEQHASVLANHVAPSTSASQLEEQDPSVSVYHMAEQDLGASANHTAEMEEVSWFVTTKVKLEDDFTESCDFASAPVSQQGAPAHGNVAEETGSAPGGARPLFVFRAMKRRSVEGDTENRPYKCTFCNWAFKKSSNLLSHMDTHSGLKPHVCDLCGKAYAHQGTLQQHRHLHTGERPYRCPLCSKAYTWSSDYRKHIRTHTGEKPYACGQCGKEFVRSSDLRKHERNLHPSKPLPCATCGKTFSRSGSLQRHQRTHLSLQPFYCPDWGRTLAAARHLAMQ